MSPHVSPPLAPAAAVSPPLAPAAHIDGGDFDQSVEVNLKGTGRLILMLEPLLKAAPEGRFVYVADNRAGQPFFGSYGGTKAAAEALVRSWAAESARIGPKVLLFHPNPMPTARLRKLLELTSHARSMSAACSLVEPSSMERRPARTSTAAAAPSWTAVLPRRSTISTLTTAAAAMTPRRESAISFLREAKSRSATAARIADRESVASSAMPPSAKSVDRDRSSRPHQPMTKRKKRMRSPPRFASIDIPEGRGIQGP